MKRDRPAYDEAEHMAHRSPVARPPIGESGQPSLFAETQQYLEGAEARLSGLAPVADLAQETAAVSLEPPWHSERGDPPPTRGTTWASGVASAIVEGHVRAQQSKAERGLGAVLQKNGPKNPPKGMVRNRDHGTSLEAALAVEPHLSALQSRVLDAFAANGPMTDEQLERLPEFRDYKYSTVRKRRTELVTKGLLASCGKASNSSGSAMMTLFDLASRVQGSAAELERRLSGRLAAADARDAEDAAGPDPEPLDCAFREEDESGRTIGERFNDSEATY